MHFLRSLYTDKLKEEGFEAYRFTRMQNPARPPEDVILRKINQFKMQNRVDSANYWISLEYLPRYIHEKLWSIPWYFVRTAPHNRYPGNICASFPDLYT